MPFIGEARLLRLNKGNADFHEPHPGESHLEHLGVLTGKMEDYTTIQREFKELNRRLKQAQEKLPPNKKNDFKERANEIFARLIKTTGEKGDSWEETKEHAVNSKEILTAWRDTKQELEDFMDSYEKPRTEPKSASTDVTGKPLPSAESSGATKKSRAKKNPSSAPAKPKTKGAVDPKSNSNQMKLKQAIEQFNLSKKQTEDKLKIIEEETKDLFGSPPKKSTAPTVKPPAATRTPTTAAKPTEKPATKSKGLTLPTTTEEELGVPKTQSRIPRAPTVTPPIEPAKPATAPKSASSTPATSRTTTATTPKTKSAFVRRTPGSDTPSAPAAAPAPPAPKPAAKGADIVDPIWNARVQELTANKFTTGEQVVLLPLMEKFRKLLDEKGGKDVVFGFRKDDQEQGKVIFTASLEGTQFTWDFYFDRKPGNELYLSLGPFSGAANEQELMERVKYLLQDVQYLRELAANALEQIADIKLFALEFPDKWIELSYLGDKRKNANIRYFYDQRSNVLYAEKPQTLSSDFDVYELKGEAFVKLKRKDLPKSLPDQHTCAEISALNQEQLRTKATMIQEKIRLDKELPAEIEKANKLLEQYEAVSIEAYNHDVSWDIREKPGEIAPKLRNAISSTYDPERATIPQKTEEFSKSIDALQKAIREAKDQNKQWIKQLEDIVKDASFFGITVKMTPAELLKNATLTLEAPKEKTKERYEMIDSKTNINGLFQYEFMKHPKENLQTELKNRIREHCWNHLKKDLTWYLNDKDNSGGYRVELKETGDNLSMIVNGQEYLSVLKNSNQDIADIKKQIKENVAAKRTEELNKKLPKEIDGLEVRWDGGSSIYLWIKPKNEAERRFGRGIYIQGRDPDTCVAMVQKEAKELQKLFHEQQSFLEAIEQNPLADKLKKLGLAVTSRNDTWSDLEGLHDFDVMQQPAGNEHADSIFDSNYPEDVKDFLKKYEPYIEQHQPQIEAVRQRGLKFLLKQKRDFSTSRGKTNHPWRGCVEDPDERFSTSGIIPPLELTSLIEGDDAKRTEAERGSAAAWEALYGKIDEYNTTKNNLKQRIDTDITKCVGVPGTYEEKIVALLKLYEEIKKVPPYVQHTYLASYELDLQKESVQEVKKMETDRLKRIIMQYPTPFREAFGDLIRKEKDPIFNPERKSLERIPRDGNLAPRDELIIGMPWEALAQKGSTIELTLNGKSFSLPIQFNQYQDNYRYVIDDSSLRKSAYENAVRLSVKDDRISVEIIKGDINATVKIGSQEITARYEVPKKVGAYDLVTQANGTVDILQDRKKIAIIKEYDSRNSYGMSIHLPDLTKKGRGFVSQISRFADLASLDFPKKVELAHERNRRFNRLNEEINKLGPVTIPTVAHGNVTLKLEKDENEYSDKYIWQIKHGDETVGIVQLSAFDILDYKGKEGSGIGISFDENSFYEPNRSYADVRSFVDSGLREVLFQKGITPKTRPAASLKPSPSPTPAQKIAPAVPKTADTQKPKINAESEKVAKLRKVIESLTGDKWKISEQKTRESNTLEKASWSVEHNDEIIARLSILEGEDKKDAIINLEQHCRDNEGKEVMLGFQSFPASTTTEELHAILTQLADKEALRKRGSEVRKAISELAKKFPGIIFDESTKNTDAPATLRYQLMKNNENVIIDLLIVSLIGKESYRFIDGEKTLASNEVEQYLETIIEAAFKKDLHFPTAVGTYPGNAFNLNDDKRKACEASLRTLIGIAKDASLETYFQKGKTDVWSDTGELLSFTNIQYAGDTQIIRSTWHKTGVNESIAVLTLNAAQPRLIVTFKDGMVSSIDQQRDPFNVWGQVAAKHKLALREFCKPGSEKLQEYYRRRAACEKDKRSIAAFEVAPEDVSKITFVPTGEAVTADLSTPLGTDHLWICTGLSVIDRKNGRHMLAHVSGGSDASGMEGADKNALGKVKDALNQLNVDSSEITIVIGDKEENIARELFKLLTTKYPVPPERIRIIPPRHIAQKSDGHRGEDFICAPEKGKGIYRAIEWVDGGGGWREDEGDPVFRHFREEEKKWFDRAKNPSSTPDTKPAPTAKPAPSSTTKPPEKPIEQLDKDSFNKKSLEYQKVLVLALQPLKENDYPPQFKSLVTDVNARNQKFSKAITSLRLDDHVAQQKFLKEFENMDSMATTMSWNVLAQYFGGLHTNMRNNFLYPKWFYWNLEERAKKEKK